MGMKKIHELKKYPKNLEKMFDRFVDILTGMEILRGSTTGSSIKAKQFAEIGPRENLSTKFIYSSFKFQISFIVEKSILKIYFKKSGSKLVSVSMSIKTYIINSVNKAAREVDDS